MARNSTCYSKNIKNRLKNLVEDPVVPVDQEIDNYNRELNTLQVVNQGLKVALAHLQFMQKKIENDSKFISSQIKDHREDEEKSRREQLAEEKRMRLSKQHFSLIQIELPALAIQSQLPEFISTTVDLASKPDRLALKLAYFDDKAEL